MKIIGLLIVTLAASGSLSGQNIETVFSLESRGGYSTNTLLHPFVDEWDASDDGAFARVIPSGLIFMRVSDLSLEVSGGFLFESILDNRNGWSGGFGSADLRYSFLNSVSVGLQANGSVFNSEFTKQSLLMLPYLSWTPTMSTRFMVKAGSSFREYSGFGEDVGEFENKYDLYGLEIEHWPALKWRIRGTAYSLLDENPVDNHSLSVSVSRLINDRSALTLDISASTYTNSFAASAEGGTTVSPLGNNTSVDGIINQTDRSFRTGINYSFPLTRRLFGTAAVAHNTFISGNSESRSDIAAFAGIRYSIAGSELFKKETDSLNPAWNKKSNNAVFVEVRYDGPGKLFLTGEFNDWKKPGIALSRQSSKKYAAKIDLTAGIYEYKVLRINEDEITWIELSDKAMTVNDGFGGTNGLIFIDE